MRKENNPNFNTPQSVVTNFKDFVPSAELTDLKQIKNTTNKKLKFNKVTKSWQALSNNEINDKIESIEDLKEKYVKTFEGYFYHSGVHFGEFTQDELKEIEEREEKEISEKATTDFVVYHTSYTNAVNEALTYLQKRGYTYSEDETAISIGMGPKKPNDGVTNKFSISIFKQGKEQKQKFHIQIYGMGEKYELNCYIS
jgi:hypothetical protein